MQAKENNSLNNRSLRLCHMTKRTDFDGYGFNLHSEKGKTGQYIGKVDENSPAEIAGLKQGDLIVEVNGVDIGNETHKQVVQRIKSIESQVLLLVQSYSNEERQFPKNVASIPAANADELNTKQSQISSINKPSIDDDLKSLTINTNNDSELLPLKKKISIEEFENYADNKTVLPEIIDTNNASNNSNITTNNEFKRNQPNAEVVNQGTKATNLNHSTSAAHPPLNLQITAAEMRAKLQARKKYDPKNDSVDLRKKFDIVQKL